jgi:hypothetical protein
MIFGMIVGPHLLGLVRPIGRFTMFVERIGTYTLLGDGRPRLVGREQPLEPLLELMYTNLIITTV